MVFIFHYIQRRFYVSVGKKGGAAVGLLQPPDKLPDSRHERGLTSAPIASHVLGAVYSPEDISHVGGVDHVALQKRRWEADPRRKTDPDIVPGLGLVGLIKGDLVGPDDEHITF